MIRVFKSTETDFSHNETVLSEIISCKVTEEINADYIVELEYPIEDTKGISSSLSVASTISVPTIDSRNNQLFRIIEKESTSSSIIVQAQAKLLADLKTNRIKALTITGKTRKEAITEVLHNALESHDYTVGNTDTNVNTSIIVSAKEGNLLTGIIGDENSVLAEYGGEFIVDNDTIEMVDQRGEDNGVVIEYGKNLSSIKETINLTDLTTVLIPKSGNYRLPEYYIESQNVGAYEKRYYQDVDLNLNIWDGTGTQGDSQITEDEAYVLMREACNKMFTEDKVDQITFNYTVDFIELSKTEEYKDYKILETVSLGDTVYIKHKKLNLNLEGRVNKIIYRVDSEGITTIDTVEIGFTKQDITDIIGNTVKSIQFAKEEINLSITNTAKHIVSAFSIADDTIKQSVTDLDNKTGSALSLQATKISAIVESNDGGMTWVLKDDAFIVACTSASDSNVTINLEGLIVNNGKILVKNSNGDTVFKVNTNGKCTAVKGFVVEDGEGECCYITTDGVKITNSDGYTGILQAHPTKTGLYIPDDLFIGKDLRITQDLTVTGYVEIGDYAYVDKDLDIGGTLTVGGNTLREIIDARIKALT